MPQNRILYFQSSPDEPEISFSDSAAKLEAWAPFSEACLSLTPKVSVPEAREVFLDIAGSETYFGGEAEILCHLERLCVAFGVAGHVILTDRAEWARAFVTGDDLLIPHGQSHSRLLRLPISRAAWCGNPFTLRKEWEERSSLVAFMRRVGLETIAHFAHLGATAVIRRFGKLGSHLQDWVQGRRQLRLPPFEPPGSIQESIDAEEITGMEQLMGLLQETLQRVSARLEGRGLLAKQLRLRFHLESRRTQESALPLAEPLRDSETLLRLLQEALQRSPWDAPLCRLELEVTDTVPAVPGQLSLFDASENRQSDLAGYLSRLRMRYGEQAAGVAELTESYLPERSWRRTWPPPRPSAMPRSQASRPLFLFSPPRPFSLSRSFRLTQSENLDVEWWDAGGRRRYFIAVSPRGERLWIFWNLESQSWFLHGTFD